MPEPPVAPEYRTKAGPPRSTGSLMDEYGLPSYPGQKHLCGQREFRPDGEKVTWDAFESADPLEAVRERLGARLGERGFVDNATFTGWRLPPGAPPTRELELVPNGRPSAADRCPTKPAAETQTVIVARRW
jgi:hypothetical protein